MPLQALINTAGAWDSESPYAAYAIYGDWHSLFVQCIMGRDFKLIFMKEHTLLFITDHCHIWTLL